MAGSNEKGGLSVMEIKVDVEIDVRGLRCPRPLLKSKQTLELMQPRQVLKIISDDMTTKSTFPSYTKHSGDEIVKVEESGNILYHYIRKK